MRTLKSQTLAPSTPTVQGGDSYGGHRACCAACHKGVREGGLARELADPKLVQVCEQGEIDDGEGNVSVVKKDHTVGAPLGSSSRSPGVAHGRNTSIGKGVLSLTSCPTPAPVTCRGTSCSSKGKQFGKMSEVGWSLGVSGSRLGKRASPEESGTQAPVETSQAPSAEQLQSNGGGRWAPVGGSRASAVGLGSRRG